MTTKIDYTNICNQYCQNAADALKKYLELDTDKGFGFIVPAQVLNPFLRVLETLNEKGIVVIPLSSNAKHKYCTKEVGDNNLYMIIKSSLVNYQVSNIESKSLY